MNFLVLIVAREVSLSLRDGKEYVRKGSFNANETTRIISLGMQDANETLSLRLTLEDKNFYVMDDQEYFYYIDWAVFEDAMERLSKDQYQITEYTETSFKGSFTASREEELVMTTIAYDEGWRVFVDGREVEIQKALGSLVSFYIDGEAGETHTVEMIYRPRTHVIGCAVTIFSIVLLILLIVFEKLLRRVPVLRALVGVPIRAEENPPALAEGQNGAASARPRYRHKYGTPRPRRRGTHLNRKD